MKKIRIGIIGVGGIANSVHIPGYLECDNCEITAICDINEKALITTAQKLNLNDKCCFKDYKDLLKSNLVDAIDIATSNDMHVKIALDCLAANYPISIEKPIGMNFEECKLLARTAKEKNISTFVCFSWRYRAFPRYMKYLIDNGEIGDLYHIYVTCIKNSGLWEGRRLDWRFQKERASSGVLCDLGSHMFDAIRFFGYEFEKVFCDNGIIIKKRQKLDNDEWADVTTDDWDNVVCHLTNGVGATVTLSRTATTEADKIEFEVIGSNGTLRYIYRNGKQALYKCTGEDVKIYKFSEVEVPESFNQNQSASFVNILLGKKDEYAAGIEEGLKSQVAIDASVKSALLGKFITIKEMFEGEN